MVCHGEIGRLQTGYPGGIKDLFSKGVGHCLTPVSPSTLVSYLIATSMRIIAFTFVLSSGLRLVAAQTIYDVLSGNLSMFFNLKLI